ncbi:hypothetical protein CPLU01_13258 [Colletotrichum plurivorum]|uniref:Uncharacterized protein n=1 Tax=Colletotrichum plurivorum TaxID=2175906 RepID=A0A8H6JTY3_9PEZI|nr:hypothetical protein CPLU01_13258 [Colletotrichum plurivorum]
MPLITDLPCELVASVLASLDDLRSLCSALLASRHIYASFKAVPGIEASVIRRQVTPGLVPYAIAVLEASRLPRQRHLITGLVSADRKATIRLLDELNGRHTELLAGLSSMPRSDLRKISDMHRLIHTLSIDFANTAWSRICGGNCAKAVTGVVLSADEYHRYCRSFYRAELFYSLFRFTGGNADIVNPSEAIMDYKFFAPYPPWENEQLCCVNEFLESKFSKVLSHDVYLGHLSVNYLSRRGDNWWTQLWLAQGLEFFKRVTEEVLYDEQKALLISAFDRGRINLAQTLQCFSRTLGPTVENTKLKNLDRVNLQPLLSYHLTANDTDNGPFQAWHDAHSYADGGQWLQIMTERNVWLWDRAYVFWDLAHNWPVGISSPFKLQPGVEVVQSDREPTAQQWDEMRESFHERGDIYDNGGQGYWTKGDLSRVVWSSG